MKLITDHARGQALGAELDRRREEWQYINGDNGDVVISIGFTAHFNFWGAYTPAARAAILECIDAYRAMFGEQLKWCFGFDMKAPQFYAKKKRPDLASLLKTTESDQEFSWDESSSHSYDAAGEYSLSLMAHADWAPFPDLISDFAFTVPYSCLFDDQLGGQLGELFELCLERLRPFNARGGLGTILPYEGEGWFKDEFTLATDFPGVYVGTPLTEWEAVCHGFKSTDWLNYISPNLVECVGGKQAFRGYCAARNLHTQPAGEGLVISSGAVPFLGQAGEKPPAELLAANSALRPLRWGGPLNMASGSDDWPRFDHYLGDLWVRRYDAAGIWPPKTYIKLPDEVVLAPPRKSDVAISGQECKTAGRYGRAGTDKPELVLLPGDVAPFALKLGHYGVFQGVEKVRWQLLGTL